MELSVVSEFGGSIQNSIWIQERTGEKDPT